MAPKVAEQDSGGMDSEEKTPKATQVSSKTNFEATGASEIDKASDSTEVLSDINFEAAGASETNKAEEPEYPPNTFYGMF